MDKCLGFQVILRTSFSFLAVEREFGVAVKIPDGSICDL
ncbi:protein of unknown function [Candidatus Methylacidiphilum fumarolicum]|uniref:Uncharacterized protein n=1 Tax=Candidatus Methylacidiphilum fumarolicum TaxID=591154 RepID=A0ABM9IFM1_9BACT|nr:protein of unknown function [Candidatus Methylacidiphilum fumarolicum]